MQQYIPFNPYMTPQQRLYQMEQQYPQLAQPQIAQPSLSTLTTVPVTNIEEANAFRVDLNGTPTFFYNAGKNEVYMKRTNTQTGLADFMIFAKTNTVAVEEKTNTFEGYEKKLEELSEKIDGLYNLFSTVTPTVPSKSDIVGEQASKGGKSVK